MRALAIIPARGGSKRLPMKNMRMLGHRPLVDYTLSAAQNSGCFSRILLSSDSKEILSMADKYSDVDALPRPSHLSGDYVTALELVCDIIENREFRDDFSIIALLLPTCPFRTAHHIKDAFGMITDQIDGVVSLTRYEFPPQLGVMLENGIIEPLFNPSPLHTGNTRSQDQKEIYRPNGGFYIQQMTSFVINHNFFKGRILGYIMDRFDSTDIDTELDLKYAQFLMDNQK